jgi:hypothetical protein
MTSPADILFEEKQYLGHNRLGILIRTLLALFCFLGYYWSENPNPVQVSFVHIGSYPIRNANSGPAFFIMGISILLLSAGLTFIPHIKTRVYRGYILLDGFWTSRLVKIDLRHMRRLRKSRYKKTLFRRSSYNLHNNGLIRFYTSGDEFVELTDNEGFSYRIGSHRSDELYRVIRNQLATGNEVS